MYAVKPKTVFLRSAIAIVVIAVVLAAPLIVFNKEARTLDASARASAGGLSSRCRMALFTTGFAVPPVDALWC